MDIIDEVLGVKEPSDYVRWAAKSIKRRGVILTRIDSIDKWPLVATRNEWAKFLGINYQTMRNAYERGALEGDYQDNRIYHTRRQILAWKVPRLLEEMDEDRRIRSSRN